MKLLFVTSTLTSGGAERVISILANEFAQRGHDVEMVALTSISPDFYRMNDNVRFIHADKECKGGLLKEVAWFRKHLKAEKPDCVIAFMEAVYEFVLFSLLGTEIPVISSERKDPATLGPLRKVLRWLLLPTVAAHVVQTKKIRDYYNKGIRRKTHVIYNPVDERVWPLHELALRDELKRERRIVSVGRLYPQKNQLMLIKAFAKVADKYPDYSLVIFGEGFLRDELQETIDQLGLHDRVRLPGRTSTVIEEVARSEVFCLSSNFEGMSNAMIEAMCVGTPVISTRVSGTDELIKDGDNGLLVDIGDEQSLAMAMDRLLGDKNLREKLSKKGCESASLFKTEKIVDEWDGLIKEIVSKNR